MAVAGLVTGVDRARVRARRHGDRRVMIAHDDDRSASLQEAVLPRHLPVLAGLDVAAAYLLSPDAPASGDWIDVVAAPAGRVVLVVGDVVGRGVDAIATMSQLRAVL